MALKNSDAQILQYILKYCFEVETTSKLFRVSANKIKENFIIRNALSMPIQQIEELVKHLTKDFTESHTEVPWRSIRGMRNIFAHDYGNCDPEKIWGTVSCDIPMLRKYCIDTLRENNKPIPKPESIQNTTSTQIAK